MVQQSISRVAFETISYPRGKVRRIFAIYDVWRIPT